MFVAQPRELSRLSREPPAPSASPEPQPQKSRPQQQRQPFNRSSSSSSSSSSSTPAPAHDLFPSAANPPASTRPPSLSLPERPPVSTRILSKAYFSYLYALSKAYLTFYKTGLKQIYTNTRLLYSSPSSSSSSPSLGSTPPAPYPSTRAHLLLRLRWQHDVSRLPLFALLLLVCGELTPLAVLALPRVVPLTCRIPRQVERLLRGDEARRAEGRREASEPPSTAPPPAAALAKILAVPARAWTPAWVVRGRVRRRLRFLAVDDALLAVAGGADALVADEVRLACADRGVAVLGQDEAALRHALATWLRVTDVRALGEERSERARVRLLLTSEGEWGKLEGKGSSSCSVL